MKSTSARGLKALLGYLWQHKKWTALGLLGLLVANGAQVAVPFLTRAVIDGLKNGATNLTPFIALTAGAAVLSYAMRALWRYSLYGVACRCDLEIRRRIYAHAMALDLTYHNRTSTGHIMSLATSDAMAVRTALAFALMSGLEAVVSSALSVWALFAINARLAVIALLPFPILGLIMRVILHRSYASWDGVQASLDEMTEKSRESISGIRVLKAMVQGAGARRAFARETAEQYRRFMHYIKIDSLYTPTIQALAGVSAALLLGVGGPDVVAGRMTVGDFAAFAAFLGQLTWPVTAAAWTLSLIQRGAASMERILTLLEEPAETHAARVELPMQGHLHVENLTFRYPNADHPALDNLSFELRAGGSLGIVGEVGSGKSTLTRLLLRLYEPPAGIIWLDGVDITSLHLQQLRQQVAWVEQEAFLFSRSIRENLLLGGAADFAAAARQAQLHDEVMSFPEGYETLLGERGVLLSGGQRQRLSLARALLKPAPILVLDDTLSAVDAHTERRILEALQERRGTQTTLVISHRVSSVRDLDEILVLESGRVVQRGTHDELLAQSGPYRKLHELQTQEAP